MRRSASTTNNALLAVAGLLAAAAAVLMSVAFAQGLYGSSVELAGWSALLASGVVGSVVAIRRTRGPWRQLEERAQELASERRSRTDAEWLRRVAERAALLGDPEETLNDIARMEAALLGVERWMVVVYDRQEFGLSPSAEATADRLWRPVWDGAAKGGSGAVYLEREKLPPPAAAEVGDARGVLLTPLRSSGSLEGFILLLPDADATQPSAEAIELAGTIGRQASLVLENAYLYQQSKSRADNLETIFRISQAVGSSLQSRVVLNRVLDVVQKILSADAVLLMRYDPQRKRLAIPMARGILGRDVLDATYRPGEDLPGRVFERCEPVLYEDIAESRDSLLAHASAHGLRSALAVPLLTRGRSIGVLVVLSRVVGAFTTRELELLGTFASQAALAVDNAELFSREHDTVRVLQESILPVRLPHIAGIQSASIYLPAAGEAEIGGDYYDLFSLPNGVVAFSIGDVCGKGVNAATKTSMIRYAVRGMLVAGLGPAEALAELNRMLIEQEDVTTNLVTLWLGCLETTSGKLVYANGGHPPAQLMRVDRSVERLGTTGPLLGGIAGARWGLAALRLEPDSVVLLHTDGVTEARRGTRFFGEGRVRRALRAGGESAQIAERLLAALQRFTGGEIRDDAAIMTVRYAPVTDVCQDVTHAAIGGK